MTLTEAELKILKGEIPLGFLNVNAYVVAGFEQYLLLQSNDSYVIQCDTRNGSAPTFIPKGVVLAINANGLVNSNVTFRRHNKSKEVVVFQKHNDEHAVVISEKHPVHNQTIVVIEDVVDVEETLYNGTDDGYTTEYGNIVAALRNALEHEA